MRSRLIRIYTVYHLYFSVVWHFYFQHWICPNAMMEVSLCCIWRDSIKPSLRFSWFCVFFVSKGNLFFTFISLYGSLCCAVWRPSKVSKYIIIVQVIFYFLWDHWPHPGYFENQIPLKPALGGICSLANYSVAYEETQSTPVSDFRGFVCSLFPKAIIFFYFYSSYIQESKG